jgi:hypothetical protein
MAVDKPDRPAMTRAMILLVIAVVVERRPVTATISVDR